MSDRQYLTFTLAGEDYAVDILRVQEIKGYTAITPLPGTPDYLRGVINLRGNVVPVLDLRRRLGMTPAVHGAFTVIVLVSVGARVHGLIVDSVADVVHLQPADIVAAPELGAGIDSSFIGGLARPADRLIVLLDVDRLVAGERAGAPPPVGTDRKESRP
jgi:purine-binding chemotaxis protein CheW